MSPVVFLTSMGPLFGAGFAALTGLACYQMLAVIDLSASARQEVGNALAQPGPQAWKELTATRGALQAAIARAQLTASSIPTLALLGTCLGFFWAIVTAGRLDLGVADPLVVLQALMDGGVATALATTVCGQGLYFVLGQAWSIFVAGRVERAAAEVEEAQALLRQVLTERRKGARPAHVEEVA